MKAVTQEQLKELFEYRDGRLFWKVKKGNRSAGSRAGTLDISGYRIIGIDKNIYLEHRLIWLWHKGYMPLNIDHRDTIKDNNLIENLREATDSNNNCNRGMLKNNTSGFKGVSFSKDRNKWVAAIKHHGKTRSLGRFFTPELAHEAYKVAAIKYHGEFANF